ncbi:hypothetical protein FZEAL_9102 [Fusarium zealandicum]|uniref:Uncharacterized protein n=1 Tax=Fusarium zealandicum TaxID=1053134 RepID=A0A8H4XH73_9HYPO|nr:hypothetical protein FZEAL_9102 [Fusarium zealandicum]
MITQTLVWGLCAFIAPLLVDAKLPTTQWATETVFLPSRSTGSASTIYASVITESGSKTEYLLACQTNFGSSYTCDGDFNGVTVTYDESAMSVAFGATTYDCELGSSAVCATRTMSSDADQTTTLGASESASRMTAIAVVQESKKKPKAKPKSSKGSSKSCKHSSRSSCSKSTKKTDDDRSTGSTVTWNWGALALLGGAYVAYNLR